MISEERLSKALTYLAETDEKCAKAKAYYMGLDEQTKTIKAGEFLKHDGTVAEREATAYASSAYREHLEKVQNANADYETMRNKRLTEELIVEVWRSLNSQRRKGNL